MYDIIVIGAGASGMMAAIVAAKNKAKVAIIEQKDSIGKKLLATGNGKCNYTNLKMGTEYYHGDIKLVKNGLDSFSENDTLEFFEELGILPYVNNGYVYPNSKQAASVLSALRMELSRLKVDIYLSESVENIICKKKSKGLSYEIHTKSHSYMATKLIIATGLKANPKLGSDGSILDVLAKTGHTFSDISPALCGFYCKGLNFKKVAGVRCDVGIESFIDEKSIEKELGELQLTDYGISGIPVFQLSSNISRALCKKKTARVIIDFMPSYSFKELSDYITRRKKSTNDNRSVNEMLNGLLNNKLLLELIHKSGVSPDEKGARLNDSQIQSISKSIKQTKIEICKQRGYEFAQVCTGGIRTSEINYKTLESKLLQGVYFAGEILDVDGICGGYNLQWAWSSGYIAGVESSK